MQVKIILKFKIWGKAEREAVRHCKSDSGNILGGRNFAHRNAT